jgi:glutamyl-tRNA synthetase
MSENSNVRVRFAPSPTGALHIGGVRTALYNYLIAKKYNGTMILRIEDTDQNRFVPGAEDYIKESLAWLGIDINEGPDQGGPYAPYRQSERMDMYAQYAYQLIESGHAYYAFDTTEELDEMRKRLEAGKMQSAYSASSRGDMKNSLTLSEEEVKSRLDSGDSYVIRIKLPRKEDVRFHDEIRGWVVINTSQMDDKVILKGDGMPTYHLANVVDDYLMKISHVIRGEEWLPSAPLHVLLYRYLGWEDVMPKFAHLPLLLKPEGNGKLSKRDGDRLGFPVFPLQWTDPKTGDISSGYRESGYAPEAVLNMLALLGWHPSDNREVFTMDELIQAFSLEKVSKSGAKFDLDKALWFNHHYLVNQDLDGLLPQIKEYAEELNIQANDDYLKNVVGMMREKVTFLKDTLSEGMYFFTDPTTYDEKVISKKWNQSMSEHVQGIAQAIEQLDVFDINTAEKALNDYAEKNDIKIGQMMQPLRVAISGAPMGPPFYDMLALLGKEIVVRRLHAAVSNIPVV